MNIDRYRSDITARLRAAGIDTSGVQTRVLMESLLGIAPLMLTLEGGRELTFDEKKALDEAFAELESGKPTQYIIGTQAFLDMELIVTPDVLIPRPETEELALLTIGAALDRPSSKLLDLCTGSCAIALAVKRKAPLTLVAASDISESALEVAKRNIDKYRADIELIQSDMFCSIDGRYDIIVSNPPYVTDDEYMCLEPNVRDHEPKLALTAGADGLDFYRIIAKDAPRHLTSGGELLLEIGSTQAKAVSGLLEENFRDIEVIRDMQGAERMIRATVRE